MLETVTLTLHSSPLHNNGQHLSKTSDIITIYLIYQQRNVWIFNKQQDKKTHVRKVPEVRLLSPVLRLACNLRAASVDEGKEKTRLIDASEEHYANCWFISPGQLSVIWTPVLGGRPEDKTGRDFTSVWCNQLFFIVGDKNVIITINGALPLISFENPVIEDERLMGKNIDQTLEEIEERVIWNSVLGMMLKANWASLSLRKLC